MWREQILVGLNLREKFPQTRVYQRTQSLIYYFHTNSDLLVTEGQGNQQRIQCTCYCKSHQTETYTGVPLFVNCDTQKTGVLMQLLTSPHEHYKSWLLDYKLKCLLLWNWKLWHNPCSPKDLYLLEVYITPSAKEEKTRLQPNCSSMHASA
jgi:hypothetical protein